MENKVILILVDGMRPDALETVDNPYAKKLISESVYGRAQTVMPSVTLPCHMSLFHSVDPSRHGVTTNTFTPQVRPVEGLCERIRAAGKSNAFIYTWEELRDLARPDSLTYSVMYNHRRADTDTLAAMEAARVVNTLAPDFLFLYLGETDEVGGHDKGWMSETYMGCIDKAVDCVKLVKRELPPEYTLILTADHGGHDRMHGTDLPEDMTIPLLLNGPAFKPGGTIENASILDIAPTIAKLVGASGAREWEGKPLI